MVRRLHCKWYSRRYSQSFDLQGKNLGNKEFGVMNHKTSTMRLPRNHVVQSISLHIAEHVVELHGKALFSVGTILVGCCQVSGMFLFLRKVAIFRCRRGAIIASGLCVTLEGEHRWVRHGDRDGDVSAQLPIEYADYRIKWCSDGRANCLFTYAVFDFRKYGG